MAQELVSADCGETIDSDIQTTASKPKKELRYPKRFHSPGKVVRREWFPYKRIILLPVFLSFIGFLTLHVGAYSCLSFQIKSGEVEDDQISTIGYWSVAYPAKDGCFKYPKIEKQFEDDEYFKAGRGLGVIGTTLAWFVEWTMFATSVRRIPAPQTFKRCLAAAMYLMAAFSILVLIGLGSERLETFKVGIGAGISIAGAFFWICGGVSVMYCIEDRDPPERPVLERSPSEIA